MISNPAKFFAGGGSFSDMKEFIYDPGPNPILWHFSPKDNGLSQVRDNNMVFFASTKNLAFKILGELFDFALSCAKKQHNYYHKGQPVHWEDGEGRMAGMIQKFTAYKKALDAGNIKLERAPVDQFYIVGWADNDTLH